MTSGKRLAIPGMAPLARWFALLAGVAFTLAGVGGFVPWFTTDPHAHMPALTVPASYGLLLGLFPINVVHNLIHLAFGLAGLLAYRGHVSPQRYAQALALILGAFTVLGLVAGLRTTFGALPLFGHDVWLHGLEALLAGYIGFVHPKVAGPSRSDALVGRP